MEHVRGSFSWNSGHAAKSYYETWTSKPSIDPSKKSDIWGHSVSCLTSGKKKSEEEESATSPLFSFSEATPRTSPSPSPVRAFPVPSTPFPFYPQLDLEVQRAYLTLIQQHQVALMHLKQEAFWRLGYCDGQPHQDQKLTSFTLVKEAAVNVSDHTHLREMCDDKDASAGSTRSNQTPAPIDTNTTVSLPHVAEVVQGSAVPSAQSMQQLLRKVSCAFERLVEATRHCLNAHPLTPIRGTILAIGVALKNQMPLIDTILQTLDQPWTKLQLAALKSRNLYAQWGALSELEKSYEEAETSLRLLT